MDTLVLTRYPLVAAGVASLLPAPVVAGRFARLPDALAWLSLHPVDLLVTGVECLLPTPATALARLRDAAPGARVLALAGAEHAEHFLAVVRGGADGLVLYDSGVENVAAALATLATGGSHLDPGVQIGLMRGLENEPAPPPGLTPREMDVLQGVARGLSNKAIGRELQLQEGTVKTYLRRLRKRMGARDRTHAVVHAMRIGLVQPG